MRNWKTQSISNKLPNGHINTKVETFKQSPYFVHLSEDKLNEIAGLATACYFRKGETIFQEGDKPLFFHILQKGRVKMFKQSITGKNFTVAVLQPGDTIHSAVLFDGIPRWASAQAMGEAIILRVRREDFLSFVAQNPGVAMNFTSVLAEQVHWAYDRLIYIVVGRVEQRLVNILWMLSSKFGTTLYLTCEEIADLVGTTTETTIRVMSRLKNSGIIESSRGKIVILDESRLRNLSMAPPGLA